MAKTSWALHSSSFRGHAPPPPVRPNHYVVHRPREALRRVLWSNPTPRHDRSRDVVGPYGHVERAAAWIHVVGAALFATYAVARVWLVDQRSLAAQLSGLAITINGLTFATSVMYHALGTVPGCAPVMRNVDHLSIYLSMGVSGAADCALVTNDLRDVPIQCLLDPLVAATVLGVYFTLRRVLLPVDETRVDVFENQCQLGIYRFRHSDLEHAGVRTAGVSVLMTTWVLLLPAAVVNLGRDALVVHVVGRVVGSLLLVLGVLFDGTKLPERALAATDEARWDRTGRAFCAGSVLLAAVSVRRILKSASIAFLASSIR